MLLAPTGGCRSCLGWSLPVLPAGLREVGEGFYSPLLHASVVRDIVPSRDRNVHVRRLLSALGRLNSRLRVAQLLAVPGVSGPGGPSVRNVGQVAMTITPAPWRAGWLP